MGQVRVGWGGGYAIQGCRGVRYWVSGFNLGAMVLTAQRWDLAKQLQHNLNPPSL